MSNLLAFRQNQEAMDDVAEATDDVVEATDDVVEATGDLAETTDDVAGTADDVAEFCQRMRDRLAEKERQDQRDHQQRIRTLCGMALVGLLLASVLAYLLYSVK